MRGSGMALCTLVHCNAAFQLLWSSPLGGGKTTCNSAPTTRPPPDLCTPVTECGQHHLQPCADCTCTSRVDPQSPDLCPPACLVLACALLLAGVQRLCQRPLQQQGCAVSACGGEQGLSLSGLERLLHKGN